MTVLREVFTSFSTIGRLLIMGSFEAYVLEDPYHEIKIPGQTCIPYGRYEVAIIWSDHYQKMMPYLLRVPNFDGVMIHTGNVALETRACLLIGRQKGPDRVSESQVAFDSAYPKILKLCQSRHTYIEMLRG